MSECQGAVCGVRDLGFPRTRSRRQPAAVREGVAYLCEGAVSIGKRQDPTKIVELCTPVLFLQEKQVGLCKDQGERQVIRKRLENDERSQGRGDVSIN